MRFSVFLTVLLWCWTLPSAQAYVPPSEFIVKSLAQKRSGPKAIRVTTQVTALNERDDGKPIEGVGFKVLTVYDPGRQAMRAWAFNSENQPLYAVERSRENLGLITHLLFQANPSVLSAALLEAGVPIKTEGELLSLPDEEERRAAEISSLRRWQGMIAWVIGLPKKGQPERAQLWVEKGSFLPLRMITPGLEVRFERFHFNRGFPYPRALLVGNPDSNPMLGEELVEFSTTPMVADFRADLSPGLTETGKAAPSAVRRLLDQYFRYVR